MKCDIRKGLLFHTWETKIEVFSALTAYIIKKKYGRTVKKKLAPIWRNAPFRVMHNMPCKQTGKNMRQFVRSARVQQISMG